MDSLRLADGGKVECRVTAPDGTVLRGVIEEAFFEDFMGEPKPVLSEAKRARIIHDNVAYFEKEAERQWQSGLRELVIR